MSAASIAPFDAPNRRTIAQGLPTGRPCHSAGTVLQGRVGPLFSAVPS